MIMYWSHDDVLITTLALIPALAYFGYRSVRQILVGRSEV